MRPSRHIVAAVLCVLLCTAAADAQGVTGGLEFGVSSSTLSDFGEVGLTTLQRETGTLFGVFVAVPLTTGVALQPEVVYTQKGIRGEGPSTEFGTFVNRFDYLEIPILLRLGAARGGPYVVAGPAFSFLLRANVRFEAPGFTQSEDIKDEINGPDVGVIVGVGVMFGRFGIEGRFDAGLRNLVKPADRSAGDPEPKNRSVSLLGRLAF